MALNAILPRRRPSFEGKASSRLMIGGLVGALALAIGFASIELGPEHTVVAPAPAPVNVTPPRADAVSPVAVLSADINRQLAVVLSDEAADEYVVHLMNLPNIDNAEYVLWIQTDKSELEYVGSIRHSARLPAGRVTGEAVSLLVTLEPIAGERGARSGPIMLSGALPRN